MQRQYYYNNTILAQTAAALAVYKVARPLALTPMAECYGDYISANRGRDNDADKMRFFRVARYLGWNVRRRGADIYENGVKIWQLTAGN